MVIQDLELLAKSLEGKIILISDTYFQDGLAFSLSHVLRNYCSRIFCIGADYKIRESLNRFRVIENGKIVLIKGDIETERSRIYGLIKRLNSEVDYEIIIKRVCHANKNT